MSRYFLIIEDNDEQYDQIRDLFLDFDGFTNVANDYSVIKEFNEILKINQPKNNRPPIKDKVFDLLNDIDGDLVMFCDLNLYSAKTEIQKMQQGINILRDYFLPIISISRKSYNTKIIIGTKYEKEKIEVYFEKLNAEYSGKNITFDYVKKKFDLSDLHEDFIEDLKNLIT